MRLRESLLDCVEIPWYILWRISEATFGELFSVGNTDQIPSKIIVRYCVDFVLHPLENRWKGIFFYQIYETLLDSVGNL